MPCWPGLRRTVGRAAGPIDPTGPAGPTGAAAGRTVGRAAAGFDAAAADCPGQTEFWLVMPSTPWEWGCPSLIGEPARRHRSAEKPQFQRFLSCIGEGPGSRHAQFSRLQYSVLEKAGFAPNRNLRLGSPPTRTECGVGKQMRYVLSRRRLLASAAAVPVLAATAKGETISGQFPGRLSRVNHRVRSIRWAGISSSRTKLRPWEPSWTG